VTATALLKSLSQSGFKVSIEGEAIRCRPTPPGHLLEELRRQKAEIMAALGNQPETPLPAPQNIAPVSDDPLVSVDGLRSTLAGIYRHFGSTMTDGQVVELENILDQVETPGADLAIIGRILVREYETIDPGRQPKQARVRWIEPEKT